MSKKEKPFKVLLGRRVAIEMPESKEPKKEKTILLTPELQKAKEEEEHNKMLEATEKLLVVQVGTEIDGSILKEGDYVYVPTNMLSPGNADPIIRNGKLKWLIIPDRVITGIY